MNVVYLKPDEASTVVKKNVLIMDKRIKQLKALGAKTTEGVYVKDGKARSIIDG